MKFPADARRTNILLLVISTVLSLLFLEGAVRVTRYGWDSLSPRVMNSLRKFGRSGLIRVSENEELIYELKPDLKAFFKKAPFLTNTEGLRDKSYDIPKDRSTFRVAVLGDSVSMPSGIPIEKAYHTLLEEKLGREYPLRKIEFINFSVSGYDLRQYAAVLESKAAAYKPDLVLIGLCVRNDWSDDNRKQRQLDSSRSYTVPPVSHPFFESHTFSWLEKIIGRKLPGKGPLAEPALDDEKSRFVDAMFGRIQNTLRSIHSRGLAVVLDPNPLERIPSKSWAVLAKAHELEYIDASRAFRGTPWRKWRIYRDDNHPNEAANQLFADQLYGYLNSLIGQWNKAGLRASGTDILSGEREEKAGTHV